MEGSIICSVKCGVECKLISVDGRSSYDGFVEKIIGKFPNIKDQMFNTLCTVAGISKFEVGGDDDFANMMLLCLHSGSKIAMVELSFPFEIPATIPNLVRCESSYVPGSIHILENDCGLIGGLSGNQAGQEERVGDGFCGNHLGTGASVSKNQHKGRGKMKGADYLVDDLCGMPVGEEDLGCHRNADMLSDVETGGIHSISGDRVSNKKIYSGRKKKRGPESGVDQVHCGIADEFCGKNNVPIYDVCPEPKKVPLLSNEWAKIMKDRIGAEFKGGAKEYRKELIKYTSQMGFQFRYTRNDPQYVHAVCSEAKEAGCSWFIKAKRHPVTRSFEVYKADFTHKCVGKLVNNDAGRLGAAILGDLLLPNVKKNPYILSKGIKILIKDNYGIDVNYSQAWRTIEFARNRIFGSYVESYDQLRWYCRAIERTNLGSVVALEADSSTNCFERVFIAFKACIDGFRSCRPMLFIDGTFMKGRARGTLLTATAKDGDNGLFPVAFAVVSAETKDNWIWFLRKLSAHIHHDKQVAYISDRNAGLMEAFPLVFVQPVHFYCLYHLITNLKSRFRKNWNPISRAKLVQLFKEVAYAPNVRLFDDKFKIFKEQGGSLADDFLKGLDFDKWVVAHSKHITRYGEMTSNAAESFNAWIREARELPITYMIECIRTGLCKWYVQRRKMSSEWKGALCASKELLWNILSRTGRTWIVSECPDGGYQVYSDPSVRVELNTKQCSCYQWQIRGFPCAHAVAVIRKVCKSVFSHVEQCFFTENYKQCYKGDIIQIPETERFECQFNGDDVSKILPPILKRTPGRPKKERRPSKGEYAKNKFKKALYCQRCGRTGSHDSITCSIQPEDDNLCWSPGGVRCDAVK